MIESYNFDQKKGKNQKNKVAFKSPKPDLDVLEDYDEVNP